MLRTANFMFIKEVMNFDLNLTYKQYTSLTNFVNFDKNNSLRWVFGVDFLNKLKLNMLI